MAHTCDINRCPCPCHPKRLLTKLTAEDVAEIRRLYARGQIFQRQLARRFRVSDNTISNILTFKFWKPEERFKLWRNHETQGISNL